MAEVSELVSSPSLSGFTHCTISGITHLFQKDTQIPAVMPSSIASIF
jgi:hypothetical protein